MHQERLNNLWRYVKPMDGNSIVTLELIYKTVQKCMWVWPYWGVWVCWTRVGCMHAIHTSDSSLRTVVQGSVKRNPVDIALLLGACHTYLRFQLEDCRMGISKEESCGCSTVTILLHYNHLLILLLVYWPKWNAL